MHLKISILKVLMVDYKKLEIYHLAHNFVLVIYELCKTFPKYEDNNLTSQLRRAATCLPLNIAEGSGARSNKIFLNYLIFCYRSCNETEAALKLAIDLKYITKEEYEKINEDLDKFFRKLYRYMEYIESQCNDRKRDKSYFYKYNKYHIDKENKNRENMNRLC